MDSTLDYRSGDARSILRFSDFLDETLNCGPITVCPSNFWHIKPEFTHPLVRCTKGYAFFWAFFHTYADKFLLNRGGH